MLQENESNIINSKAPYMSGINKKTRLLHTNKVKIYVGQLARLESTYINQSLPSKVAFVKVYSRY